jgi:hypothetical protein
MLAAYRLAGLSALCGTLCGRQMTRNAGPRGQLGRLVQMVAKDRRLAGNSKLGDEASGTNKRRAIVRVASSVAAMVAALS